MRIFNYLTLFVAIIISICAAYYSIVGLTAIFAGAFWPIVIMGTVLEVGKITTAVWLHLYWKQARWWMKVYLVPAVAVLMVITSMGIFGFLSKAHLDSTGLGADTQLAIELIDNKIEREETRIQDSEVVLAQLDAAVQALTDAQRIRGAEGAIAVREAQKLERESLTSDIDAAYNVIAGLREEKLTLDSARAAIEAEVGPLKYVASLIYGNDPTAGAIEDAVRWVIILLVAVFDPLAVVMVLAAAQGLAHTAPTKEQKIGEVEKIVEVKVPVEVEKIVEVERIVEIEKTVEDPALRKERDILFTAHSHEMARADTIAVKLEEAKARIKELEEGSHGKFIPNDQSTVIKELSDEVTRLLDELAFRKSSDAVDTITDEGLDSVGTTSFGTTWPLNPVRGDLFLKIDTHPNVLYKWNSRKWIEIDRARVDDTLVYDSAYIDYLIQQVRKGHQDYEDLTEMEQKQIIARVRESEPSA